MLRSIEARRILVWPATYHEFNVHTADAIAVAIAFFLPLSTSAVAVLVVLWLLALLPTLSIREVRQQLATWPGALPVALVLLAVAGMLWADVGWSERLAGIRPLLKLLVIPLLFIQFQRSDRGLWVVYGFMAGCTLLLTMSFVGFLFSVSLIHGKPPGIVVKDYISPEWIFRCMCLLAA
ncbi:cadmium resistance protein CadD (predicted permease) [Bradyrhizobium diazoefficiens]